MAEKINKYDLMIALKPLLPDDVRKAIHKNVTTTVTGMGGEVLDTDVWGKRYLAYKVKGHNEGYYILYTMTLETSQVAELKRQLGLKPEILRFMIVQVDKKADLSISLKKKEIEL